MHLVIIFIWCWFSKVDKIIASTRTINVFLILIQHTSMKDALSDSLAKKGSIGSVAVLTGIVFILVVLDLTIRAKTFSRLSLMLQSSISAKVKGYTSIVLVTGLLGLTLGASSTLGLVLLAKREKTSEPVNIAGILVSFVLLVCAITLGIVGPEIYNASTNNESDADKKKITKTTKSLKSACYWLIAVAIAVFAVPAYIVFKDYNVWKENRSMTTTTVLPTAAPPITIPAPAVPGPLTTSNAIP